jgi:Rrf2 family protein
MALYGANVECGLHCLLYLVDTSPTAKTSSADLAELQGVSPSFVAKIFTQLKAGGLVEACEGRHGGYRLARDAQTITVLDVVEALEGEKPLFECREIRRDCVLFGSDPPTWAVKGPCSIHAVMLEAEKQMKESLAGHTLADLARRVARKAPKSFAIDVETWLGARKAARRNTH